MAGPAIHLETLPCADGQAQPCHATNRDADIQDGLQPSKILLQRLIALELKNCSYVKRSNPAGYA